MTNQEAADELQYAINLIKQDGKDWLDERDIPILEAAISALQAQDSKTRKICKTCKHDPPSKKWPCVDCDMREPADRWELQDVPDTNDGGMISRKAAIDAVSRGCKEFRGIFAECEKNLSELPSAQSEQRWIPCSKRLPKVGTYVLVSKKSLCFRSNLPNVCTAHRSRDPRSGKEEWNDMLFGKLDDDDVLAWMPLPEPYRAERKTDEHNVR